MAKTLDDFDWSKARTRSTSYEWDEWFNGETWRLEHGEDFTSKVESFRSSASTAAKRMGKKVRTANPEDGVVVLQAYGEREDES